MAELNEVQAQVVKDVAATGEAIAHLRPILGQAALPLPFRLPDATSWGMAQPSGLGGGPNDDLRAMNRAGGDDDDIVDGDDETDPGAEAEERAKAPVVGRGIDTGILRATCSFLVHGDPRTQKLTAQALKWAAKRTPGKGRAR